MTSILVTINQRVNFNAAIGKANYDDEEKKLIYVKKRAFIL